jgi:hypothetical protein
MKPCNPKRANVATVLALAILIRGVKLLRDVEVATLFGLTLPQLYERIGSLLWSFTPNSFLKLPANKRDGGRVDARPVLAFTPSGVLFIASILNDRESLEIGTDIFHALSIKRRSSAYRKRPARRAESAAKAAGYHEARGRLSGARSNAIRGNRDANAYALANLDPALRVKLRAALRRSKKRLDAELKIYLED